MRGPVRAGRVGRAARSRHEVVRDRGLSSGGATSHRPAVAPLRPTLGARFVAGADEAGRGSLAGPLVVAGVLLDYAALRDHRVRPLAPLNDSKQVDPAERERALPRRPRCRLADRRARHRLDRHRPPRPAPLEPLGAAHRARRAPSARRGVPRRRLPARAAGAAARRRRRRRHEERRDRRGLDRREGDARPLDAPARRALPALRLLVARRLHHARSTRAPCARTARARSTGARFRAARTSGHWRREPR